MNSLHGCRAAMTHLPIASASTDVVATTSLVLALMNVCGRQYDPDDSSHKVLMHVATCVWAHIAPNRGCLVSGLDWARQSCIEVIKRLFVHYTPTLTAIWSKCVRHFLMCQSGGAAVPYPILAQLRVKVVFPAVEVQVQAAAIRPLHDLRTKLL